MKLSDFLAKFPVIEEAADGYVVHCPSHSDSNPSLRIGVSDKVLLKCRAGCKTEDVLAELGITMRTLARMEVDSDAAPARRARSTGAPASTAATAALAVELDGFAEAITATRNEDVLSYARDRFGLTDEDVQRLGLGAWNDRGTKRLVVPFRDPNGVPRGHQARAIDADAKVRWKGPKSPDDGGSWAKVGFFPGGAGWSEVLITEGPGDALTAAGIGYDAIAIRGAALATNPDVVDAIVNYVGSRKVIIAGDGDSAGWDFSSNLARALLAHDVSAAVLAVPDGEDLSSWRESDPTATEIVRAINDSRVAVTAQTMGRELDDERYPLGDAGAARWVRDFIRRQGSDVRFTPEAGFYLLNDGVWRRDDLDAVRAFTQEAFEDMISRAEAYLVAAEHEGDLQAQERAVQRIRHAKKYRNTIPMNNALTQLKALRDVATRLDDFDQNPHLLACKNGVVDLRSGDLLPHSPTHMLTRRINHDYKPDAKAPRWTAYLEEIFPNHPEMPSYMQRLIGYGITGNTDEQCFVVLYGRGANGKSVFTDTLTEVFRETTVTTAFQTFEHRPSGGIPNDLAALKGARLVMASEGEADKPMAEAVLKRVTGKDLISARFMRQEFFEFRPSFLLFLSSNAKPRFKGQDEGLWRRVRLIPFERYFAPDERDFYLGRTLLKEAEGIIAWAVAGAVEWYKAGLRDPGFVREATQEYRENSNLLDGFLPGEWEHADISESVPAQVLYDSYLTWADEENLSAREIWTRRTFYAALEERGMKKVRSNGSRVFLGVRKGDGELHASPTPTPRAAKPESAYLPPDTTNRVSGASLADLDPKD